MNDEVEEAVHLAALHQVLDQGSRVWDDLPCPPALPSHLRAGSSEICPARLIPLIVLRRSSLECWTRMQSEGRHIP